jgi:hypothetical protein
VAGTFGRGNKTSDSITCDEVLDQLSDYQFIKRGSVTCSYDDNYRDYENSMQ